MFVPSVILAVLLILVAGALMAYSKVQQRQYLRKLQGQIAQLEPKALHALTLDRRIESTRARARLLDDFRARPRKDLEALNDLTRMLAPPTWTNMVEMNRESATVSGEAENAAALLSVIDNSKFFHNSEFSMIGKSAGGEVFRVRTLRGERK
jgi:general secretion pathway protein L